jgi:hypothetical protein
MQSKFKETFIIAFSPGCSGKFLANIIWHMYQNFIMKSNTTMFNSWHGNSDLHMTTYDTENYDNINYKTLKWCHRGEEQLQYNPANIGVFFTHIFPEPDDILDNSMLDDTKFIIIRPCHNSLLEVIGNTVYKNEVQRYLGGNKWKNIINNWNLYHAYVREVGYVDEKDFNNILRTDKDGIQILIKNMYNHNLSIGKDRFLNCNIPEQIKDRTLVIDYLDIFQKTKTGYLALNKIEEFTNKKAMAQIRYRYHEYVKGREQFIKEHLYNLVPLTSES